MITSKTAKKIAANALRDTFFESGFKGSLSLEERFLFLIWSFLSKERASKFFVHDPGGGDA
jgi:hypothetical protein